MPRELSKMTKKDFNEILKKQGIKKEDFLNYHADSNSEKMRLEVGLLSKVNKVLEEYGAVMVLQGCDRQGDYLFKIVKK